MRSKVIVVAMVLIAALGLSACSADDASGNKAPTKSAASQKATALTPYMARKLQKSGKPDRHGVQVLTKLAAAVKAKSDSKMASQLCPALKQRLKGFAKQATVSHRGKPVKLSGGTGGVASQWQLSTGGRKLTVYLEAGKVGGKWCLTRFIPNMKLSNVPSTEKRLAAGSKTLVKYLDAATAGKASEADKLVCHAKNSKAKTAIAQAKYFTRVFADGKPKPDYLRASPGKSVASFVVVDPSKGSADVPLNVNVVNVEGHWCIGAVAFSS